ncbi:MAG: hypothetical protein EBY73_07075 [Burkholderiaceae bacterium]|nr:hypothetical protein [Burkholderiaceae bacterium]
MAKAQDEPCSNPLPQMQSADVADHHWVIDRYIPEWLILDLQEKWVGTMQASPLHNESDSPIPIMSRP